MIEPPDDFIERVVALVDAYNEWLFQRGTPGKLVGDKATTEPFPQGDEPHDNNNRRSLSAKRADALFDLLEEVALVETDKLDPEIAAIGVTVRYEDLLAAAGIAATELGTTLTGEAVRRIACDAGIHRIIVRGVSEILDVGRKTRTWNRPQPRAIRPRHGDCCAAQRRPPPPTTPHPLARWGNAARPALARPRARPH